MQELNINSKSKFTATSEQKNATNPNKSFWVTANAGTGKTKVLVDRILSLLFYENNPEKILCITFTKAGASEMITRLTKECRKFINYKDEEIKNEITNNLELNISKLDFRKIRQTLNKIIDNPNLIKIETIHALCGSILKNFPLEANIVPFFEVIDEIKSKQYLEESWLKIINSKDSAIINKLKILAETQAASTIKETIFQLLQNQETIEFILSKFNNFEKYIENLCQNLDVNINQNYTKDFFEKTSDNIEKIAIILSSSQNKTDKERSAKFLSYLKNENFYDFLDEINKKVESAKIIKNDLIALEILTQLRNITNFYSEKIKNQDLIIKTECYLFLYNIFIKFYSEKKEQNYQLDYQDLISKTQNLLNNSEFASWVLYKLDGGISHILVDEAQDTSPSQWNIIKSLTADFYSGETNINKNRTIFVVGDEKQSIFSFQGANIENFYDIKNYFSKKIKSSTNSELEKISLNLSFRSLPAILNFVDKLAEIPEVKNAISENEIYHKPSRIKHFGYLEVNKLIQDIEQKDKNKNIINWFLPSEYDEEKENKKIILAKKISNKISEILFSPHILPSTNDQAKASDVIILFRKRDVQLINYIESELNKLGIKCSGLDKSIINENIAVLDILSAIKFHLNCNDDYNTACLLKSCLIGFSEELLIKICTERNQKSIYEFLKEKSENNEYKIAYNFLEEIRKINFLKPSEFIFYLIETLGYRKNFINNIGNKFNDIFDELISITYNFERNENVSLINFINWFEKNSAEIKKSETKENQVKIMTCHSSKGLEAPIIFIADTTSETKEDKNLLVNDNIIIAGIDAENKSNFVSAIQEKISKKLFNESLRLLYVAITRARDELYVYGIEPRSAKAESWHQYISKAINQLEDVEINDENFIYTNQAYIDFTKQNMSVKQQDNIEYKIPKYFFENAEIENNENKILPSLLSAKNYNQDEVKSNLTNRGTIIHRLLEILPNYKNEQIPQASNLIFNDYNLIDENSKLDLLNEAKSIINNPDFNFIFNNKSQAEIEVSGYVDGQLVNGKIDRLIIDEQSKNIYIIDFKTHQNIKDENLIFENYKPQMFLYYKLIKMAYTEYLVKPAILLTSSSKILYYNFE